MAILQIVVDKEVRACITQLHSPRGGEVQEETKSINALTSETVAALTSHFPLH